MLYALEPMSEKGPLTQYEDKLKGDILVLEDTLDDIAKEKAAAAERPATPAAESFVETITVSDEDDDDDECSGIPAEVLEGNNTFTNAFQEIFRKFADYMCSQCVEAEGAILCVLLQQPLRVKASLCSSSRSFFQRKELLKVLLRRVPSCSHRQL